MPRLAVFDIDGTLTDTNEVDDECFLLAVADVLELDRGLLDWSDAPHVTDSSLVHWLCDRYCRRPLRDAEASAVLERFLELLDAECAERPERFRPIPGAVAALDHVKRTGWDVALATGGWPDSARLKLSVAGFDPDSFVLASASDALSRQAILQLAVRRASAKQDERRFSRIVSIGDGVWDVKAAMLLEWPFIGIATARRADAIRAAGAEAVLPDLSNIDALMAALENAEAPLASLPSSPSA